MGVIISAKNLNKTYDMGEVKVEAVKNISLEIEEGYFYAIIGKSGSGKSTLLHLLSGFDRPTKGMVTLRGENLHKMNVRGKVILQPHGKDFFTWYGKHLFTLHGKHFFTDHSKDFFLSLWPVLSQEEVSIGLFLVYWKAVHKRGELYADENTDATNTGPETNGLYQNGYHPLL